MQIPGRSLSAVCLIAAAGLFPTVLTAQKPRPFTVADDIGLSYFGDPFLDKAESIVFSPDGKYFVAHTERGRLDLDRPESTLRVYKLKDVREFLAHREVSTPPAALWELSKATYKDGPVIQELRWLADSDGFGFLAASESGNNQLFLADLATKQVRALTPEDQNVKSFDIRNAGSFVYTALSPVIREKAEAENQAVSISATKRSLANLLSPVEMLRQHDLSELWAAVDGKRFRIDDPTTHEPLGVHWRGQQALALSPDGRSVLVALPLAVVPRSWETLYLPPFPTQDSQMRAGPQDSQALDGWHMVSQYALIDLREGSVKPLPLGPLGYEAGWWEFPAAAWSPDGHSLVLANTFLDRSAPDASLVPVRPCEVAFDLANQSAACLEPLKGFTAKGVLEEGYHLVKKVRFGSSSSRIVLEYSLPGSGHQGTSSYLRSSNGSWTLEKSDLAQHDLVDVFVRQSLNDPPVLAAAEHGRKLSRVIWDPNPQLKAVELSDVSVYKWKDDTGRELVGGLFKPFHYVAGQRYPLVIQTHGFSETEFIPSGIYNTSFAARALAGAGFVVLQVRGCRVRHTPEEGLCQVTAYESAVKQLAADGLVDPGRVGIVGFSRTCFYVLEALTKSTLRFKAASIASGVDMGYLQYMLADTVFANSMDSVIGAPPFGAGLEQWLKQSPGFNMDKVNAPLMVVAVGRADIAFEWEPYSTLLHLKRPVDLIVLKEGTHPLSNPGQRMASQGGTVDWMRFWLKGEEDPDAAKQEQYQRWRELRRLEEQQEAISKETVPVTAR